MIRTDYERIAPRYDADRERFPIGPDPDLTLRLARATAPVAILDVGCGTGAWLAAQHHHAGDRPATWSGADPSPAMLERARAKCPWADLRPAGAEDLPFPDAAFAFVYTSFACHHLEDKERGFAQMRRVLAPGGSLRLVDLDPWRMPGSWLYRFFPACVALDHDRFWPAVRLRDALEALGLTVAIDIQILRSKAPRDALLAEAESRTTSQLAILPDADWMAGLAALRALPDDPIATEVALLRLSAERPAA